MFLNIIFLICAFKKNIETSIVNKIPVAYVPLELLRLTAFELTSFRAGNLSRAFLFVYDW